MFYKIFEDLFVVHAFFFFFNFLFSSILSDRLGFTVCILRREGRRMFGTAPRRKGPARADPPRAESASPPPALPEAGGPGARCGARPARWPLPGCAVGPAGGAGGAQWTGPLAAPSRRARRAAPLQWWQIKRLPRVPADPAIPCAVRCC